MRLKHAFVGWVQRSATHHALIEKLAGYAALHPPYITAFHWRSLAFFDQVAGMARSYNRGIAHA